MLVGHSYGGAVITNVDADAGEIVGLVYVAALRAGARREPASSLVALFPGSTLGDTLEPVPRADGTTDLTIARDRFHTQFCADVPARQAALMAATQRPVTREALVEPSGDAPALAGGAVVVRVRRARPQHPGRGRSASWPSAPARSRCELAGASHAVAVAHPPPSPT